MTQAGTISPANGAFLERIRGIVQSLLLRPQAMQFVVDVISIVATVIAYQVIREHWLAGWRRFPIEVELAVGFGAATYFAIIFWFGGLYKDYFIRSPFDEIFRVIKVTFVGSAAFYLALVFTSATYYRENPRLIFLFFWLLSTISVSSGRLVARSLQRRLREAKIVQIRAVIYGTTASVEALIDELNVKSWLGYAIVGVVLTDSGTWTRNTIPVLGNEADLRQILVNQHLGELLIAIHHPNHEKLLKVASIGADAGLKVKIVPDLYEIFSGQARTLHIHGAQLIDVQPQLMEPWEEFLKRAIDIVVSLTVLLAGLPIWILTALAIKANSRGPVFYSQKRVGRSGQIFNIYKFRSMYVDDNRKPSWTTVNDPRVTAIGRFIRKTHIDEFPQLWNVLRGEMSLVGPRPEQPFYVEKFSDSVPFYRRRLKVRPGVTGWWQVKYTSYSESVQEIEDRLRYDFYYIENMSVRLDIEILVRTIVVMLRGHGQA